jgi:hypothetical protein
MRQGRRRDLIVVVLAFVVLGLAAGCGKKDDPLPPDIKMPDAIQNLTIRKAGEAIRLTWEMEGKGRPIKEVRIRRSDLETLRGDCPGCPRDYKEIVSLLVEDPLLVKESPGRFRYDDFKVKTGWLYTYRVIVCDVKGYCSEPSEPAELKF